MYVEVSAYKEGRKAQVYTLTISLHTEWQMTFLFQTDCLTLETKYGTSINMVLSGA